jgi:hypothetical protein
MFAYPGEWVVRTDNYLSFSIMMAAVSLPIMSVEIGNKEFSPSNSFEICKIVIVAYLSSALLLGLPITILTFPFLLSLVGALGAAYKAKHKNDVGWLVVFSVACFLSFWCGYTALNLQSDMVVNSILKDIGYTLFVFSIPSVMILLTGFYVAQKISGKHDDDCSCFECIVGSHEKESACDDFDFLELTDELDESLDASIDDILDDFLDDCVNEESESQYDAALRKIAIEQMEYTNQQWVKSIYNFDVMHQKLHDCLGFIKSNKGRSYGVFVEEVVMILGGVNAALKIGNDSKSLIIVDEAFNKVDLVSVQFNAEISGLGDDAMKGVVASDALVELALLSSCLKAKIRCWELLEMLE